MKLISILMAALILTSATVMGCEQTQVVIKIPHNNYVTKDYDYQISYPAEWELIEWETHIALAPIGEFSMYAEIYIPDQHIPIDTWLSGQPPWCSHFQQLDRFKNGYSFTGVYGEDPIYGMVHVKEAKDKYCVISLACREELQDYRNFRLPDELQLILDTFQPIKNDATVTYIPPSPPPMSVAIDQLYAEYMADEVAANAKYTGERLAFCAITVDEVHGFEFTGLGGVLVDFEDEEINIYILSDSVKFQPRYSGIILSIGEDNRVDIVGEVQGLIGGFLVVADCWIDIVSGTAPLPY